MMKSPPKPSPDNRRRMVQALITAALPHLPNGDRERLAMCWMGTTNTPTQSGRLCWCEDGREAVQKWEGKEHHAPEWAIVLLLAWELWKWRRNGGPCLGHILTLRQPLRRAVMAALCNGAGQEPEYYCWPGLCQHKP